MSVLMNPEDAWVWIGSVEHRSRIASIHRDCVVVVLSPVSDIGHIQQLNASCTP